MSEIDRKWIAAPREFKVGIVETSRACADLLESVIDSTDEAEVGDALLKAGLLALRQGQLQAEALDVEVGVSIAPTDGGTGPVGGFRVGHKKGT